MKLTFTYTQSRKLCFTLLPLLSTLLTGCINNSQSVADKQQALYSWQAEVESALYHSGGVFSGQELCPQSPFDTVTPISAAASVGDGDTLQMSIIGMQSFIDRHNITHIQDLLTHLPDHYRSHFSLVEHTRATGQANLEHPRIVLYGSDGRFLLNVGTKPDDPEYNLLDVAELNTETGKWEFSVFDFNHAQPKLTRNPAACNECHGSANSRPIWGTFQQWTGVFGDSVIDGPRPEALDHTHAFKMNDIILGQGGSPRFDFLLWKPMPLKRGGVRHIAHHDFGPELLISNIAMGSATALGAYLRLTKAKPEQYKHMRKSLLLAYFDKRVNSAHRFKKITQTKQSFNYAKQQNSHIKNRLAQLSNDIVSLDKQLGQLGLEPREAFSLTTLHETEQPDTSWSTGAADLYDMLMLQILNDLRRDDPQIRQLLTSTQVNEPVFQCPDVAKSIADLVDFKMLHLFYLSGQARYQAHWVYYPKDLDDIYEQVFLPIADELLAVLAST